MKKNKSDKKANNMPPLQDAGKSSSSVFSGDQTERKIRHVEGPISFLSESVNEPNGKYGQAEDLYEKWGLDKKQSSIANAKRHTILKLVSALVVVALVNLAVFYILPAVLPSLFEGTNIELFVEKEVNLIYGDDTRVVTSFAASLMSEPDITSQRITQVLYNEPLTVISGGSEDSSSNGYIYVQTQDGITGYIRESEITDDTTSIEPDLHQYKLVVSETTKNIMTHASSGTLITRVGMNTVLYADVKRDGVYQVALPNGDTGWIGSSEVIEIGVRDEIQTVSCRYFVSSVLSQVNATYIENGITMRGMSINGLVYVASEVNGIDMPRTIEGQMQVGSEVELEYDIVTGKLLIDSIIPGDLVFLRSPYGTDEDTVYEMAVCTDSGTLMMISTAQTSIRLRNFDADSDIASRIICVRRVFW